MVAVGLPESGNTLRPFGKVSFLFLCFDPPQSSCDCLPFLLLPVLELLHTMREPMELLPPVKMKLPRMDCDSHEQQRLCLLSLKYPSCLEQRKQSNWLPPYPLPNYLSRRKTSGSEGRDGRESPDRGLGYNN
jgi:hypothetical protein